MIIVFDTNIWIENLFLRSPAGAAARFYIIQKKARVGLPEVIKLEVEHHLRQSIRSYINKIKDSHGRLLAVFGTLKEIVLPTDTQIEQKVSEGTSSLGVETVAIPFSFESAKDSFLRTINKKAPSDRSQQFKDGVLWADCLSLLKQDEVVLVTDDGAFYEGHNPSSGLAVRLRDECSAFGYRLTIYSGLSGLLKEIRSDIKIDHDSLCAAFLAMASENIQGFMQRTGFQLSERTQVEVELFFTESPEILFLEFKITFTCIDISGEERGGALLTIRGDGLYNSANGEFSSLGELGSELRFTDTEGIEQELKNIILRAGNLVLGHRDVSHRLRVRVK